MAQAQVAQSWHEGEVKMHELLHVPDLDNPTAPGVTAQLANALQNFSLLAIGTLDSEARPWTTLWGGETPLAAPIGPSVIGIRTPVEAKFDPVLSALFGRGHVSGAKENVLADDTVRFESGGKMLSGLAINLDTRKRVKFAGRAMAGAVKAVDDPGREEEQAGTSSADVQEVQMAIKIEQSLGNCPKYLNKKTITPSVPLPSLLTNSSHLPANAIKLINRADLFFVSSSHLDQDMDTNHRGGPPGFIRVLSNDVTSGAELVWPEYSGNRLYQTLGNLKVTPRAGLTVPDFTNGDVLYLTGETTVLVGKEAAQVLPRSNLAIRYKITDVRFVANGLPFRGEAGEASPYNPAVRPLASEGASLVAASDSKNAARLVSKTTITPTITRYRFSLTSPPAKGPPYRAGQWVALDFATELDLGYSHMREDDPGSLNDDFVRTFTISSAPSSVEQTHKGRGGKQGVGMDEFELTVRRHGPVTKFLQQQNERSGLEIPILGFGGEFIVKTPPAPHSSGQLGLSIFIAGGVGITPLLGQLPELEHDRLRLIWIINDRDAAFVWLTLESFPDLAPRTTLFLTGEKKPDDSDKEDDMTVWKKQGVRIEYRRPRKNDIEVIKGEADTRTWYSCAAPPLQNLISEWLVGEELITESFEF